MRGLINKNFLHVLRKSVQSTSVGFHPIKSAYYLYMSRKISEAQRGKVTCPGLMEEVLGLSPYYSFTESTWHSVLCFLVADTES